MLCCSQRCACSPCTWSSPGSPTPSPPCTRARRCPPPQVVQCLTEMGLSVKKARISSDGGWFVDEFQTDRITDGKKLKAIK